MANGRPLSMVLELFLDDLPFVPAALSEWKLLQVFLELEDGDHEPAYNEGAWFINTETSLEGLKVQKQGLELSEFALSWNEVQSTPGYPDDIEVVNEDLIEEFEKFPTGIDITSQYFGCVPFGLWVGGWPAWINGSDVGEFVLQMSGDIIKVDLGFDGVIYVGLDDDQWRLVLELG